jgi:hypothetical protein
MIIICLLLLLLSTASHKVTVSFLEVYNENIRDLLSEMSTGQCSDNLDLREDPIKGPVVAGITEVGGVGSYLLYMRERCFMIYDLLHHPI